MINYLLYLESGPKRRKTMVHVLDLLGCIANGPTTEAALQATPQAIRAYLRFLKRHGEDVGQKAEAEFTTTIAVHITEGQWLGNGNPTQGFAPDFLPLSVTDQAVYISRLEWLHEDLLFLARPLSSQQLNAQPKEGRPLRRIFEHVAGAEYGYLQSPLSKPAGLSAACRAVEEGPDLPAALVRVWDLVVNRLQSMSDAERSESVPHGQTIWAARRAMRRLLEHNWEHLVEISDRLGVEVK